jgi:uncharacterized LabA/DUF88 family protein
MRLAGAVRSPGGRPALLVRPWTGPGHHPAVPLGSGRSWAPRSSAAVSRALLGGPARRWRRARHYRPPGPGAGPRGPLGLPSFRLGACRPRGLAGMVEGIERPELPGAVLGGLDDHRGLSRPAVCSRLFDALRYHSNTMTHFGYHAPPTPWGLRAMLFVDGENLCFRAQDMAKDTGQKLVGAHERDVYYWPAQPLIDQLRLGASVPIRVILRSFYYCSAVADDPKLIDIRSKLKSLGFNAPCVFKKQTKREKSKQVDIQLSVDMLSNAYLGNYDVAILISGDADFVPVVREVQRLGKYVYLWSFDSGLGPELKLAADCFGLLRL